ncbi:hypothetical protein Ocin01_01588 [Orchesella cincta]|uniref:Protein sleepless n=1 Tax=Orchesella cincta TaxID=48709 RepID=A0A1D2NIW3_ORCCI|nr:hypothetical protein Ocin01_01588 [Orchesella cincta]
MMKRTNFLLAVACCIIFVLDLCVPPIDGLKCYRCENCPDGANEFTCTSDEEIYCSLIEAKDGTRVRDCATAGEKQQDTTEGVKCDEIHAKHGIKRCFCDTDLCNDNSILKMEATTTSDSGRAKVIIPSSLPSSYLLLCLADMPIKDVVTYPTSSLLPSNKNIINFIPKLLQKLKFIVPNDQCSGINQVFSVEIVMPIYEGGNFKARPGLKDLDDAQCEKNRTGNDAGHRKRLNFNRQSDEASSCVSSQKSNALAFDRSLPGLTQGKRLTPTSAQCSLQQMNGNEPTIVVQPVDVPSTTWRSFKKNAQEKIGLFNDNGINHYPYEHGFQTPEIHLFPAAVVQTQSIPATKDSNQNVSKAKKGNSKGLFSCLLSDSNSDESAEKVQGKAEKVKGPHHNPPQTANKPGAKPVVPPPPPKTPAKVLHKGPPAAKKKSSSESSSSESDSSEEEDAKPAKGKADVPKQVQPQSNPQAAKHPAHPPGKPQTPAATTPNKPKGAAEGDKSAPADQKKTKSKGIFSCFLSDSDSDNQKPVLNDLVNTKAADKPPPKQQQQQKHSSRVSFSPANQKQAVQTIYPKPAPPKPAKQENVKPSAPVPVNKPKINAVDPKKKADPVKRDGDKCEDGSCDNKKKPNQVKDNKADKQYQVKGFNSWQKAKGYKNDNNRKRHSKDDDAGRRNRNSGGDRGGDRRKKSDGDDTNEGRRSKDEERKNRKRKSDDSENTESSGSGSGSGSGSSSSKRRKLSDESSSGGSGSGESPEEVPPVGAVRVGSPFPGIPIVDRNSFKGKDFDVKQKYVAGKYDLDKDLEKQRRKERNDQRMSNSSGQTGESLFSSRVDVAINKKPQGGNTIHGKGGRPSDGSDETGTPRQSDDRGGKNRNRISFADGDETRPKKASKVFSDGDVNVFVNANGSSSSGDDDDGNGGKRGSGNNGNRNGNGNNNGRGNGRGNGWDNNGNGNNNGRGYGNGGDDDWGDGNNDGNYYDGDGYDGYGNGGNNNCPGNCCVVNVPVPYPIPIQCCPPPPPAPSSTTPPPCCCARPPCCPRRKKKKKKRKKSSDSKDWDMITMYGMFTLFQQMYTNWHTQMLDQHERSQQPPPQYGVALMNPTQMMMASMMGGGQCALDYRSLGCSTTTEANPIFEVTGVEVRGNEKEC